MPAIVSVAGVPPESPHGGPLSARVMVTTVGLVRNPVAKQLLNPVGRPIAGAFGMPVNAGGKATVMVLPPTSVPVAVGVNPAVHVAPEAPALWGDPEKV